MFTQDLIQDDIMATGSHKEHNITRKEIHGENLAVRDCNGLTQTSKIDRDILVTIIVSIRPGNELIYPRHRVSLPKGMVERHRA